MAALLTSRVFWVAANDALTYCGEHITQQLEVNLGFYCYEKMVMYFSLFSQLSWLVFLYFCSRSSGGRQCGVTMLSASTAAASSH